MEMQPLIYFRTVARLENMSRAAEQLHITQPALSKSIAQLERSLGVELFYRNGRSIHLNRYGQFFLERVEVILREYDQAREDLLHLIAPGQGEVSIGFMHTLGLQVIPALMTDVKTVYPQMRFQLTQNNSGLLLKKLALGELDICLVASLDMSGDIHWEKLWDEELFLIVPKQHSLSSKKSVSIKEFAKEPFISIKKGNSLRKTVDTLYKREGLTLNVAFEGEEIHTVAGLVESGLGVSLIPHIKGLEQYNVHVISVDAENCKREIGLAYLQTRFMSPVTDQFINYLRAYFEE
ncbi:LysR family transcriptional regulator [Solibacillus sp. CAU 1738]|uniref:LysR family transcriptional regulator n=1 Tax=Solibacillus sp. CAU 1738 TaxID=3140363 RepID=UPI003260D76D